MASFPDSVRVVLLQPPEDFDWSASMAIRPLSPIVESVALLVHTSANLVRDWDALAQEEVDVGSLVSHRLSPPDGFTGLDSVRIPGDVTRSRKNRHLAVPDPRLMCTTSAMAQTLAPLWFPHGRLCSLLVAGVCIAKGVSIATARRAIATTESRIGVETVDRMSLKQANSTMRVKLVEFEKNSQGERTPFRLDGDFASCV
jgi:hypothetical protein